jgi:hypothetical protein
MEPFWGMSCDSEMGRFFDWMDLSPGMAYADAYVRVAYELTRYILKGGRQKPLGYGRKNYRLLTCTSISK